MDVLEPHDSNQLVLPGNLSQSKMKRDPPACAPNAVSSSNKGPTTSAAAGSGSKPSSSYHGLDPDGFNPECWCVCQASITLPVISAPAKSPQSDSCRYTALQSAITTSLFKADLPPATTSSCVVYQKINMNKDNDVSVPGCVPTGKPKTSVTLSKNPVHVGNMAGQSMYDSIMRVLKPKCPDPIGHGANCDSTGAGIDRVHYVEKDDETLETATVTFTIEDSNYTTSEQRNSMLSAVTMAFNGSASGKNCHQVNVDTCLGGKSEPNNPLDVIPPGPKCYKMTMCNLANLVSVVIEEGGHEIASTHIEASFAIVGWNLFDCELIVAIVGTIMDLAAVVAPETAAQGWSVLGEIQTVCDQINKPPGKRF